MFPFRTIVVATDFGPCSKKAVDLAASMAATYGAELSLVHVTSPIVPHEHVDALPALDAAREEAERSLSEWLDDLHRRGRRARGTIRHGDAWSEVLDHAKAEDADLVVVGTHGRKGVTRFVLGSVAERIVRASTIPVLSVHGVEEVAARAAETVPEEDEETGWSTAYA